VVVVVVVASGVVAMLRATLKGTVEQFDGEHHPE
jgi:hypothetical protein